MHLFKRMRKPDSWKKRMAKFCLSALFVMFVYSVFFFAVHGIPLWGIPDETSLAWVEVTDHRLGGVSRRYTDPKHLRLAQNASHLLNYRLGKTEGEDPIVSIVYEDHDGRQTQLAANATTVWVDGKAKRLKKEHVFVNVVEGLFFSDLLG